MDVVQYIIESCLLQKNADTPQDFVGMTRAYDYIHTLSAPFGATSLSLQDLSVMAGLVKNFPYIPYRSQPAMFENGNIALDAAFIQRQLGILVANQHDMTADEFYFRFEEIHPWHDGNGRVGSLVWNFFNGTLGNPNHPPHNPAWVVDT